MPTLTSEVIQQLIQQAAIVRDRAYAPYSNYHVGAALLGKNGTIYTGCNVENASYPTGICAERTAVAKAVSEGCLSFDAILVMTADGGTPCGSCRQVLNEFNPEMQIVVVNAEGKILLQQPLNALLPEGFGPANLHKERVNHQE
jgi:cytidine deaminase